MTIKTVTVVYRTTRTCNVWHGRIALPDSDADLAEREVDDLRRVRD